jgi:C4-dicarboxylate-binding protein DctP
MIRFRPLAAAALLSVASGAPAAVPAPLAKAPAPIIVKLSHVVVESTPKGQAALKFKELAEKRFPGRVEVRVYPRATLYGDAEEVQALLRGDVNLVAPAVSKLEPYTRKLQVFELPFLFRDLAALERFERTKDGRALLDAMSTIGIRGLAYWHSGMKELSSDRPRLRRPEDLKGLKVRIPPSAVIEAQFRALGAEPLKMDYGEVYRALRDGAVDAQENTWSNIYAQKLHEVQQTIAVTNHGVLDYMVITNAKWWNSLPADVRRGLQDAMDEATAYGNGVAAELNARGRERIAQAGRAKIQELDSQDLAEWQKAMAPVWKRFEPDIGKELIDAALKASR